MRHILLALVFLLTAAVSAPAAEKTFSQFAVDLPDGWTSDERPGFQSGHPDEYMLLLGKRGEEAVEAHITIFILPNKDKMDAKTFPPARARCRTLPRTCSRKAPCGPSAAHPAAGPWPWRP